MAKYKIPYPGLGESLIHLRKQIIHSLPYVVKNLPRFNTPEEIFNYCKSRYTFKNDPPGTELFQTVPTLLKDNEYGNSGEGDCDDATIFCISMLLVNGFDCGYVLAGRTKVRPTHIFAYCVDGSTKKVLDLTNKNFNQQRPYAFKQYIPFTISKNQLDMFLELADGGNRRQRRKFKFRRLTEAEKQNAIFLPSKQVHIPVETFDNLHRQTAISTMLSEGYDEEQLSEYLSGRAERKQRKAYRAEKKNIKLEKKKAKVEKTKAKTEIKKARAEKKISKGRAAETRAEAKRIKAERGESGGGAKLFNKAGDFVRNVMQPEEEEQEQEETDTEEVETPEEIEGAETEQETDESELQDSSFSKNDLFGIGIFAIGFYLEKTKKVA